jgi:hypothetical protein
VDAAPVQVAGLKRRKQCELNLKPRVPEQAKQV